MKKNNMLRIASVLLVAVLLSTCVISGAFAKYTASGEATDFARVAKWGIVVDVDGGNAFSKFYKDTALDSAVGATVESTAKVVAPGTNGSLGSLDISGSAEVDVEVIATVDLDLTTFVAEDAERANNWVVASTVYCPIVFTVNEVDYYIGAEIDSVAIETTAQLEAAVEAAIKNNVQSVYNAGDVIDIDSAYSWSWAFEADTDGMEPEAAAAAIAAKDEKDTALGLLLNDNDATNDPTIALTVKVTINQVD